MEKINEMSEKALRVIGFAYKINDTTDKTETDQC